MDSSLPELAFLWRAVWTAWTHALLVAGCISILTWCTPRRSASTYVATAFEVATPTAAPSPKSPETGPAQHNRLRDLVGMLAVAALDHGLAIVSVGFLNMEKYL